MFYKIIFLLLITVYNSNFIYCDSLDYTATIVSSTNSISALFYGGAKIYLGYKCLEVTYNLPYLGANFLYHFTPYGVIDNSIFGWFRPKKLGWLEEYVKSGQYTPLYTLIPIFKPKEKISKNSENIQTQDLAVNTDEVSSTSREVIIYKEKQIFQDTPIYAPVIINKPLGEAYRERDIQFMDKINFTNSNLEALKLQLNQLKNIYASFILKQNLKSPNLTQYYPIIKQIQESWYIKNEYLRIYSAQKMTADLYSINISSQFDLITLNFKNALYFRFVEKKDNEEIYVRTSLPLKARHISSDDAEDGYYISDDQYSTYSIRINKNDFINYYNTHNLDFPILTILLYNCHLPQTVNIYFKYTPPNFFRHENLDVTISIGNTDYTYVEFCNQFLIEEIPSNLTLIVRDINTLISKIESKMLKKNKVYLAEKGVQTVGFAVEDLFASKFKLNDETMLFITNYLNREDLNNFHIVCKGQELNNSSSNIEIPTNLERQEISIQTLDFSQNVDQEELETITEEHILDANLISTDIPVGLPLQTNFSNILPAFLATTSLGIVSNIHVITSLIGAYFGETSTFINNLPNVVIDVIPEQIQTYFKITSPVLVDNPQVDSIPESKANINYLPIIGSLLLIGGLSALSYYIYSQTGISPTELDIEKDLSNYKEYLNIKGIKK